MALSPCETQETKMNVFSKVIAVGALAAAVGATSFAFASDDVDPALKEKVTKQMTEQGYEVRKIQMEDGKIEVYAVKEGKTYELYLDEALKIIKTNGEGEEENEV
jgi:hypothetical protein